MDNGTTLVVYSIVVVASSLFGGWLPSLLRLTHVRMQLMLSFVGGMMLGVGVLHMLPHSFVELGSLDESLFWLLVGLIGMFLLIRTFHFHEHGTATTGDGERKPEHSDAHHHGGPEPESGYAHQTAPALSSISWVGVAFGLSLHAFLDGIALAAGVISDSNHRGETMWAGLGVFTAIVLHKPLDALSITSLMQARRWTRRSQQVINAGFAMMCPLGALGFTAWVQHAGTSQHQFIGIALAISAGVFLCISLSDLLPEVQFHRHDRLKLSTALILGVACAYAIRWAEPSHLHPPSAPHRHPVHVDERADHDERDGSSAISRLDGPSSVAPTRELGRRNAIVSADGRSNGGECCQI